MRITNEFIPQGCCVPLKQGWTSSLLLSCVMDKFHQWHCFRFCVPILNWLKHTEKKYSTLHENQLPHIVSIASPKSPASLDIQTLCSLQFSCNITGFDYAFWGLIILFGANNGGIQREGFTLPPSLLSSFKAKDIFNSARSETFYIRKEWSDHYQHILMISSENGFFRTDFIQLQLT